jgi:hypothetical protein
MMAMERKKEEAKAGRKGGEAESKAEHMKAGRKGGKMEAEKHVHVHVHHHHMGAPKKAAAKKK